MSFLNMSNNDYYLHRPGFNPSSRATYTIFHPSTNNFYTTMSVGRALLLNPGAQIFQSEKQKKKKKVTQIPIKIHLSMTISIETMKVASLRPSPFQ